MSDTQLSSLFTEMKDYQDKLYNYTISKCTYERNMETCIMEQLYFQNRSRQILSITKDCRDDCVIELLKKGGKMPEDVKKDAAPTSSWFGSSS